MSAPRLRRVLRALLAAWFLVGPSALSSHHHEHGVPRRHSLRVTYRHAALPDGACRLCSLQAQAFAAAPSAAASPVALAVVAAPSAPRACAPRPELASASRGRSPPTV